MLSSSSFLITFVTYNSRRYPLTCCSGFGFQVESNLHLKAFPKSNLFDIDDKYNQHSVVSANSLCRSNRESSTVDVDRSVTTRLWIVEVQQFVDDSERAVRYWWHSTHCSSSGRTQRSGCRINTGPSCWQNRVYGVLLLCLQSVCLLFMHRMCGSYLTLSAWAPCQSISPHSWNITLFYPYGYRVGRGGGTVRAFGIYRLNNHNILDLNGIFLGRNVAGTHNLSRRSQETTKDD